MQSDEKLVEQYRDGDQEAIAQLVTRYAGHIYNFIRQSVRDLNRAEDLTQEVFIKVWKSIAKFDAQKSFKVWIFKIARNTIIDFLRKKRDINFSEMGDDQDVFEIPDSSPLPSEIFELKKTREAVENLLGELPEKYREVILLYYQNGLNFREISEISGEPIDTIKSRHRRALMTIKKGLAER